MLKNIVTAFIFCFIFLSASAQQDSLLAEQYLARASDCLLRNQPDSSGALHRMALALYRKNDRLDLWLTSYIPLAYTWADDLKQPFAAEAYLDQALKGSWRKPTTSKEWEQLIRILMYKGHFYQWYIFDYSNAVKYYEESFQLYIHQLGEKNDKIANYIYHQLGNAYTRLGDYERAQHLLRRGIAYGEKKQQPQIGKYGDLAIILLDQGKNMEALTVLQSGLQVPGAAADALITARLSEARVWLSLGSVPQSLAALQKVLPLIAQLPGSDAQRAYYRAGYYGMAAKIQDSLGNVNAALQHYQKAIHFETVAQGTPYYREVGKAHYSLANFYLRHRKPDEALREFQLALQCVLRDFKPKSRAEQPDAAQFYAENTIIEGLIGKAAAFRALGRLEEALACYELVPAVESKLRATHTYESSKLLALSESRRRFDEAITLAWQLYERSQDRQYAERAFHLTEQARGTLLLQSLARARAEYRLPDSIRQRDYDLQVRVSWCEQQIAGERNQGSSASAVRIKQLEQDLFELKRSQEAFVGQLRRTFPDFAHLSDEIVFLLPRQVPALLRPDQAMVDYYLTETDAYIFWLDVAGKFTWRRAALPAGFREAMRFFAQYPTTWDENVNAARDQQFRQTAVGLFRLLLAPELAAAPDVHSLLLVPDDVLVFIPFEMLLRDQQSADWADLPWLLVDYNIGYAYSATLLYLQQALSRQHALEARPRYALGGFAPSYEADSWNRQDTTALFQDKVYAVKSTMAEVRKVHRLIGGRDYYGDKATEAQFRLTAPDCRVLLLAMHGFADDQHPELARLLFGSRAPDSINNNILFANELQIMQLHADLAVLSACHTGFGKLNKGEGVYSLARAFAAAGVPCTVMSLWRLHEATGPVIVEAFFTYLQAGKPKDEALRLAKLDFLKDPNHAESTAPYYWAGIMVTGDLGTMDLPALPAPASAWAYVLLGSLILGAGWWGLRRQRTRAAGLNG